MVSWKLPLIGITTCDAVVEEEVSVMHTLGNGNETGFCFSLKSSQSSASVKIVLVRVLY